MRPSCRTGRATDDRRHRRGAHALFLGGGRNGKGVFETATGFVLGDYAGSTPIETFTIEARSRSAGQATPELAKLPGIRALRTSEPEEGRRLDEA
jgi:putative DNA primase/helicase